ncbi:M48 family metalloprotease [Rhodobacteraceae bacterium NNCM2]|nr:M48 family metalloprotease [Coraliihabitans acroporae]
MTRWLRSAAISAICIFALMISGQARAQGFIRDAEIERTLGMLTDPILKAAGLNPSTVNLFIVNDKSLNAYVAAGRNIFLHTGLLIKLETPAELQGVIAHEVGHIVGGHIARRAIKLRNAQGPAIIGALAGLAIAAAGGGAAGAAITAGTQGAIYRNLLKHSRAEEASADQAALSYLERSKIDPAGLQKVFEIFRGQEVFTVGNIDPYAVTHPLSSQRLQLIDRRVNELKDVDFKEDKEAAYWHARMRSKLIGFLNDPERVLDNLVGEPETEFTLYEKAVALHRLPSPREAIAAIDQLIAKRPNDPYYIELKGQILYESGDAAASVPYYRKASKLAANSPLIMGELGRALLALNDPASDAEALEVLQEARRYDMADATALRSLATAYSRAGDYGMATLSTAERHALLGREEDAIFQARRAAGLLPEGSPGWIRAQDILSLRPER